MENGVIADKKLEKLLKIARILKTICKVIFTLSVVFACISAVFIILLAIFGGSVLFDNGVFKILIADADMPVPTLYCFLSLGILYCACEAVLSKISINYLIHVLNAGTPFDYGTSKELRRHGIIDIAVSIFEAIASGIIIEIAQQHVEALDLSASVITADTIGVGILMILFSYVCEYGASLVEKGNRT